jgi:xylan 1,4-beta-xylosidase
MKKPGPSSEFLEHRTHGHSHATGATGAPLDYVGFHAKGQPEISGGHVRMGIQYQLDDINRGFETVASFPELRGKPVIIGDSDPEGCAACSARVFPANKYRNGTMYSSYTAASFARKYDLASLHGVNFTGAVTWAFEFENQPWFDGFRDLATNGIGKPALNVFRMLGLMEGRRVAAQSSHAVSLDTICKAGVRGDADVSVLASRGERRVTVLIWHYHDDDVPGPAAAVKFSAGGLPPGIRRLLLRHYRVDGENSNSYEVWKQMGSPQNPDERQYNALERASQLAMVESPKWLAVHSGAVQLGFRLQRQGVSLLELSW